MPSSMAPSTQSNSEDSPPPWPPLPGRRGALARRPWQAALLGPAAVAVHDDRDVPGHLVRRDLWRARSRGVRIGRLDRTPHVRAFAEMRTVAVMATPDTATVRIGAVAVGAGG